MSIVRDADAIQVMTPEQVAQMRSTIPVYEPSSDGTSDSVVSDQPDTGDPATSEDTIPLNQDNRPAELKLFDAYSKFKSCIEDAGETIRGDLRDRNNPAYQDPKYVELIQTCAARSKILDAVQEAQTARADLTPEEVQTRNEAFKLLSECLKKRGWTIETAVEDAKTAIEDARKDAGDAVADANRRIDDARRDLDKAIAFYREIGRAHV